ncbi:MAG: cupredoxin domain-containing protein [Candidatus Methylomirabilales bacterium]
MLLTGLVVAQGMGDARPQRLRLEARNTRFNESNPSLEVRRRARVELLVQNAEAGAVPHNLVIAGLDVRSPILQPGESVTVQFKPTRAGEFSYSCTLHPGMMDGKIVVGQ